MAKTIRLAILQRVITPYRLDLFRILAERPEVEVRVFHGEDLPGTKVRNTASITGIDARRLETRILRFRKRQLPWHRGLLRALRDFDPDVILAEGESHLLGYMVALMHRRRRPECRLVHWSLGGLPGISADTSSLRERVKRVGRDAADRLLVYSSFGRRSLIEAGHAPERITVGVNVADTARHLEASGSLEISRPEARRRLGLPERFTVLSVGAIDPNKRLDRVLDAARELADEPIGFVIVGGGGILSELVERAAREGTDSVTFPGRIQEGLELYFRASDVLLLPGRGGMVISEAMAHGLPVVVHEADGTEYDLVIDDETGVRMTDGSGREIAHVLSGLQKDPDRVRRMGTRARELVQARFTLEHLADSVLTAVAGREESSPHSLESSTR